MSNEKINATATVTDEDLEKVTGGDNYIHVESTNKFYKWTGSCFTRNGKYLCPRCGRSVHYGAGCRFYCDPCDCSWWDEYLLIPDPGSGNWKEISEAEYNRHMNVDMYGD